MQLNPVKTKFSHINSCSSDWLFIRLLCDMRHLNQQCKWQVFRYIIQFEKLQIDKRNSSVLDLTVWKKPPMSTERRRVENRCKGLTLFRLHMELKPALIIPQQMTHWLWGSSAGLRGTQFDVFCDFIIMSNPFPIKFWLTVIWLMKILIINFPKTIISSKDGPKLLKKGRKISLIFQIKM